MSCFIPRDYQRAACERVNAAFNDGAKRVVLVAPTGSGKNTMGVLEVQRALQKGERIVCFAHRVELINDTSARLARLGVPHGVVLAGHPRVAPTAPVQVATIQTLMAQGARPPADRLVCDECHHITAE